MYNSIVLIILEVVFYPHSITRYSTDINNSFSSVPHTNEFHAHLSQFEYGTNGVLRPLSRWFQASRG